MDATRTGLSAFHYPDGWPAFCFIRTCPNLYTHSHMPQPVTVPAGWDAESYTEAVNKLQANKLPAFYTTRREFPADDCPICHDYPGRQHSHTPPTFTFYIDIQPEQTYYKEQLSKKDVKVLKRLFEKSQHWTENETEQIAWMLRVTPARIKNWFKTRRIRQAIYYMPASFLSLFV